MVALYSEYWYGYSRSRMSRWEQVTRRTKQFRLHSLPALSFLKYVCIASKLARARVHQYPKTLLFQVHRTNRWLESTLVGIFILIQSRIETHIDDRILLLIINTLDPQSLEEERFGFFKDLFSLRRCVDIVGNFNLAAAANGFGTPDTGIRRIVEKILAQTFRQWTLKVAHIQCHTSDLVSLYNISIIDVVVVVVVVSWCVVLSVENIGCAVRDIHTLEVGRAATLRHCTNVCSCTWLSAMLIDLSYLGIIKGFNIECILKHKSGTSYLANESGFCRCCRWHQRCKNQCTTNCPCCQSRHYGFRQCITIVVMTVVNLAFGVGSSGERWECEWWARQKWNEELEEKKRLHAVQHVVLCDVHLESWSRSWGPTNLGHWPCVQYKYWSTRTFVAVLYSVQLKRVQVLRLRVQVLVHTPSTSQNDWRARQSPEYCTWYTVRGYSSTHSVGRMNIL